MEVNGPTAQTESLYVKYVKSLQAVSSWGGGGYRTTELLDHIGWATFLPVPLDVVSRVAQEQ